MARFLEVVSSFLARGISFVPFQFLGISVGADLRRMVTWSLFDKLRNYLSTWKRNFISIGGDVALLNFVID